MEMDEIRKIAAQIKEGDENNETEESTETAVTPVTDEPRSITDISAQDIKVALDKNKSFEEQAEDVVGAMATAKAVQDENVAQALADQKAQEMLAKSQAKVKTAEAQAIDAETGKQKERRKLYEAVLNDFGVLAHLPQWLMVILVALLSPLYLIKTILIGVPFGIVKTIVDNLDNVMCRYQDVNDNVKPKVKAGFIFIVVVVALVFIALITLKCLKII